MAFSSDSEEERFVPAVLNRPKVANHLIHESFTVDTRDHEDHTFCGVMFDISCKGPEDGGPPLEFLRVDSISVRGDMGQITVWTTPGTFKGKEHAQKDWELVYEREHAPSRTSYQRLELVVPIQLVPGERRGVYVHSKLPGDDAIVYDNQRSRVTYEDQAFRVHPGMAHLSNRPFGRHGMWGFPWRESREFVGQVSYGVGYVLWNPVREVHLTFPIDFRRAVWTLLTCARRPNSPLHRLQDEVIFFIMNMCKHDWFSQPPAVRSPASRAPDAPSREYFGRWAGTGLWSRPRPNRMLGFVRPMSPSSSDSDREPVLQEAALPRTRNVSTAATASRHNEALESSSDDGDSPEGVEFGEEDSEDSDLELLEWQD